MERAQQSLLQDLQSSVSSRTNDKDKHTRGDTETPSQYASVEEMRNRTYRFPSVQERVLVLMSNWYSPPCKENAQGHVQFQPVMQDADNVHFLIKEIGTAGETYQRKFLITSDFNDTEKERTVFNADSQTVNKKHRRHSGYWDDTKKHVVPAFNRVGSNSNIPTLIQFGVTPRTAGYDPITKKARVSHPRVPLLRRWRKSFSKSELYDMTEKTCINGERSVPQRYSTFQPIVWIFRENLHFGPCYEVASADTAWSEKKNMVVFRGADTGSMERNDKKGRNELSDKEWCLSSKPRCRLVFTHSNSTLVDAKFKNRGMNSVPEIIEGVTMSDKGMTMEEQLKYKAIIMLEGYDVASGMKWALYSNSVVLTQWPLKYTSWAMEELLEPWVHFVPINENLTDVEEKMQWIIDNDEEAQKIAHRGSLWMKDVMFHPDSESDSQKVFDEMARRYRAHFAENHNLTTNE